MIQDFLHRGKLGGMWECNLVGIQV